MAGSDLRDFRADLELNRRLKAIRKLAWSLEMTVTTTTTQETLPTVTVMKTSTASS